MKWQVKQKIKRIAALLLSFVLLFDALEISAPAPVVRAMEESFGAFCAVTAFAELPQELREQTLPLGAQESDIVLPDRLNVTADVLKDLPANTAPAQTANAAQGGTTIAWNDEIPEEEEILDADAEPQTPAQPQTTAAAQDNVSLTVDGVEEIPYVQNTVTLGGVKWRIDAARSAADTFLADEEHAGAIYTYVAVLPEKDSAGNTVVLQEDAELPEIRVIVDGEQDAETEASGEKQSETEALTEADETESETETETKIETGTEKETDAEKETRSDLAVENEEEVETETEEITEAESETETEKEIETETDAEKETGSDLAMENGEEAEIETEIEEQDVNLMSLGEPMMFSGKETGPVYNEDGSIDLKQYITGVEFTWKDRNGIRWPIQKNAEGNYEFPNEHTLGFTLHYRIPKGVVTQENRTLSYDLPAGFAYSNTGGDIKWGGEIVGKYTINGGRVWLEFNENSSFFNTDTEFTGYVTFDSDLKREQSGEGGKLEFNDTVDFTYTITEKKEEGSVTTDSSFNASKSASWLDEKDMMHYTVEVTPGDNGATNVTLKDKLGAQVDGFGNGQMQYGFEFVDFTVVDENGQPLNRVSQNDMYRTEGPTNETKDGKTITTEKYEDGSGHSYTKVTDGDTVTITPSAGCYMVEGPQEDGTYTFYLPDMLYGKDTPAENKNKKYTIEYNVDLPKWFEGKTGIDVKWAALNLDNILTDSHNTTKADLWTSHKNDWIKKTNTKSAKLNEDSGKYEMGWKIEINPEHYDLPLNAVFKDTMNMGSVQNWENGNLTITVAGKDASDTHTFTGLDADLLEKLLPNNTSTTQMPIGELLTALGKNPEGTTTDYTITLEYTTTVDKSALPNGSTTATNSSNLEVGEHTASSSASTGGLENDKLKKQAIKDKVDFGVAKYSENGNIISKQVLLIPWEATVSMLADYGISTASIEDVFGDNLWVTPKYLRDSLKIYLPEGTPLSEGYTLFYKIAEGEDYQHEVPEDSRVIGFKIVFNESAYDSVAGQKLTLKYTLYGDTESLYEPSKWNTPKESYYNTINYATDTFTATYTREGDYFAKGIYYNYADFKDDHEVKWEELPDGRLVWRINVELADTSLEDDIIITDEFPADQLELYSVTLERNGGGSGKTEPLTEFKNDSYTLRFTDGDTTVNIPVKVEKHEDGKIIKISVTIPKELTGEGNNSRFDLRVEANIPENSDLLDPNELNVTEKFTNSASLKVGDQPSREDTHTVTVTKDTPVMEKTGSYKSDSVMHYELKANPNARLYYGKGKMLDLVDILEYDPNIESDGNIIEGAKEVSLVPGSVKAYILDTAGERVYLPIQGLGFTYKYEEEKTVNVDGKPVKRNKLTMQIPDGQTVYVEYDYVLHCNQTLNWNIKNTATLMGNDEFSDADEKNVYYQSSASEVEKITVDFYKVDENNYNITLPGAKFILYEWKAYDGSGWTKEAADALKSSNADACVFTVDGKGCWKAQQVDGDSGEIRYFVSDSKGKLPIEPTTGTLYWLKEIEAPLGYVKPESNNGYYFYLESSDNKFKDYEKPSDLAEDQVHVLNSANKEYTVYIPNESDGKISAQKIWADGTTPETVELTLYQGDGAGYTYADTISQGEEPAKFTDVR